LALIENVDARKVSSELGQRLLELDIFDTTDNSRQDGGYVPIWDAVQQTLDELLARIALWIGTREGWLD
jgi:hypothetical protein